MSVKMKINTWFLIGLNICSFIFYLVFAFVQKGSVVANVFSIIAFLTLCANMLYGGISRFKLGYLQISVTFALFLINLISSALVGLEVFRYSLNIVGIIAILSIYIFNLTVFALNLMYKCEMLNVEKKYKFFKVIAVVICLGLVITLLVVSIFAVYIAGSTPINTNTVNLALFLVALPLCALSVFFRSIKVTDAKLKKVAIVVMCIMCVAVTVPYVITEGATIDDINKANKSFENAFGEESLMLKDDMLAVPYSIATSFVGIATEGYKVDKDIEYLSLEYMGNTLSLKFDRYYPINQDEHKSVLINLHGFGGDKNIGNYAHKNKYFASKGYVVYDLQYGDFNEKNTGCENFASTGFPNYMSNLNKFFEYEFANNSVGADFSNVFITGVSMGGSLTADYAYSYENVFNGKNIILKGIIPVYPSGIQYMKIKKDSVPCLIIMSMSDCIVSPQTIDKTVEAFERAGNKNCVALKLSYAGHGCDGLMSGKSNQIMTYYTERFMEQLRS